MQKNYKAGAKAINLKSGQRASELNLSRSPVVISSSSFKRYNLEEKAVTRNTISLASIANLGRFLPFGLNLRQIRRS